jgi:hypothetical protein
MHPERLQVALGGVDVLGPVAQIVQPVAGVVVAVGDEQRVDVPHAVVGEPLQR